MPCDGVNTGYRDYFYEKQLGKLLCTACKLLDKNEIKFSGELKKWWRSHRDHDRKKKK